MLVQCASFDVRSLACNFECQSPPGADITFNRSRGDFGRTACFASHSASHPSQIGELVLTECLSFWPSQDFADRKQPSSTTFICIRVSEASAAFAATCSRSAICFYQLRKPFICCREAILQALSANSGIEPAVVLGKLAALTMLVRYRRCREAR